MGKISIIATGDYLQTQRIPKGDEDFAQIQSIVQKADAAMTNLEITISYQEGVPNGFSGGTYVYTTPDRLDDVKGYGFNMISAANNHALDYGETGLLKTMGYLREYGLPFAGIGKNKAEAEKPVYLDTKGGRVGMLSMCSSLVKPWYPEAQRGDMAGRPGANGLRFQYDLRLSPEQYGVMQEIKEMTQFNNLVDMMVKQGFVALPENMIPFGFDLYCYPLVFRKVRDGEAPGAATYLDGNTIAGLKRSIEDTRMASDTVVVNIHAHEMKAEDEAIPADFHIQAGRTAVDAGADAVVMHGSHQVRGIEIYNGKPIFYGLGNFVFQNSTLNALPQSYYDSYGTDTYEMIVEKKSQNPDYLMSNPLVMASVFAGWEVEDGKITSVTLYPVDLHVERRRSRSGFPALCSGGKADEILDRLIALSSPFGTVIEKGMRTLNDGSEITIGKVVLAAR